MSKDKLIQQLQISQECKTCIRFNKEPHNCKGKTDYSPCMAYKEG